MTGTVAVVTGGSRGIGRAIVDRLTARGHAVVFTFSSDEAGASEVAGQAAARGATVLPVRCDVTDPHGSAAVWDAADELGDVTILVNNAGVTGRLGLLRDVSDETLARVMDVNVIAPMRWSREAVVRWHGAPRRDRSIVMISSIAARIGSPGEYTWYAASKAAVNSFAIGLAKEVGPDGVRVNAVNAGTTRTTIHARAGNPDRAAQVGARVPLGRPAEPDEIAAAVDWLAGPDSGYVTGAVLDVAGGL